MTLNILTFGIAREICGSAAITLAMQDGATVAGLLAQVKQEYPAMARLSSLAVAVNGRYAGADEVLMAGSELALIPPVSGG